MQSFDRKVNTGINKKLSKEKLRLVNQDITKMKAGAIVNAANEALLGGDGIDGAIHKAAGSGLKDACAALPEISPGVRCNVGQAKITPGFNLPAANVIHTVGPVYTKYDDATAAKLLADCYTNSLIRAKEKGARTVAFPCISTGAFGYPKDKAASIALAAVRYFLVLNDAAFDEITFVCYGSDAESYKIYESLLNLSNPANPSSAMSNPVNLKNPANSQNSQSPSPAPAAMSNPKNSSIPNTSPAKQNSSVPNPSSAMSNPVNLKNPANSQNSRSPSPAPAAMSNPKNSSTEASK
jgi:O-acetyl-ADP-ribose deacetylase (regulator of RNase III)